MRSKMEKLISWWRHRSLSPMETLPKIENSFDDVQEFLENETKRKTIEMGQSLLMECLSCDIHTDSDGRGI